MKRTESFLYEKGIVRDYFFCMFKKSKVLGRFSLGKVYNLGKDFLRLRLRILFCINCSIKS